MTDIAPLPALSPIMSFEDACQAVVAFLKEAAPMAAWSVNRFDGDRQVVLSISDSGYGIRPGASMLWSQTLCAQVALGKAPRCAPDAMAVPALAAAPFARTAPIGSFVSIGIPDGEGGLFATLCGLDPDVRAADLAALEPLLDLLSSLLSCILRSDLARADQARRLDRAEALAESDPLTGLVNRRGWKRYCELEQERYRRFGDPGSVIVVDLDGLKEVNDQRGHAAGDRYLLEAAHTLSATVRRSDLVARLGGDEFGVLASRTSEADAERLAERIRRALDAAGVPASVGCAPYSFDGGLSGAWGAADAQMYADKRARHSGSVAA